MREQLETFLEQGRARSAHGEGYPRYVEQTFRRYLQCGILACGCARLHCAACGHDLFVPFSCKSRGICPSCQGRRMGELAATLVDTLLPALPYRQWVFTYPHALRRAMAQEPKLLTAVLGRSLGLVTKQLDRCGRRSIASASVAPPWSTPGRPSSSLLAGRAPRQPQSTDSFCHEPLRTLAAYQRRRARVLGLDGVQTAALCALQRFGSAINLNVHAHVIAPDAVFVVDGEALRPLVLPPPTDAEVTQVALGVHRRVCRLFARRLDQDEAAAEREPTPLESAVAEALAPTRRMLQTEAWPPPARPRCASVDGFGVHANVALAAGRWNRAQAKRWTSRRWDAGVSGRMESGSEAEDADDVLDEVALDELALEASAGAKGGGGDDLPGVFRTSSKVRGCPSTDVESRMRKSRFSEEQMVKMVREADATSTSSRRSWRQTFSAP